MRCRCSTAGGAQDTGEDFGCSNDVAGMATAVGTGPQSEGSFGPRQRLYVVDLEGVITWAIPTELADAVPLEHVIADRVP